MELSRSHVGLGRALLVALALLVAAPASRAQEFSLADVLARATDYVDELHEQLSGMVAEERYEQQSSSRETVGFAGDGLTRRVLRSDFLLVRREDEQRITGSATSSRSTVGPSVTVKNG